VERGQGEEKGKKGRVAEPNPNLSSTKGRGKKKNATSAHQVRSAKTRGEEGQKGGRDTGAPADISFAREGGSRRRRGKKKRENDVPRSCLPRGRKSLPPSTKIGGSEKKKEKKKGEDRTDYTCLLILYQALGNRGREEKEEGVPLGSVLLNLYLRVANIQRGRREERKEKKQSPSPGG